LRHSVHGFENNFWKFENSLIIMASRATRSRSRAARAAEPEAAVATGPLGALSHDELGVIFDGLADPLQPVVAVAFSSTCKGLRTPLHTGLEVLQDLHKKAKKLCRKMRTSCAKLRDAEELKYIGLGRLDSKGLTADDIATLAVLLGKMPRLRRLILSNNKFGPAGAKHLAEGISASSLTSLRISQNNIGDEGTKALAAAVAANGKFTSLYVGWCCIGDEGAKALGEAIRASSSFATLLLSRNNIGDEGVKAIAAGMAAIGSLAELFLTENKIGDEGANAIAKAIPTNSSLTTLSLGRNNIGDAAKQSLRDAVRGRQGFDLLC